jgi:hypothetical protein
MLYCEGKKCGNVVFTRSVEIERKWREMDKRRYPS